LRHVVGGYGRGGVALGPRRFGAWRGIANTVIAATTVTVASTVTVANTVTVASTVATANITTTVNTVTVADIATVANTVTTVAGFVGTWAA